MDSVWVVCGLAMAALFLTTLPVLDRELDSVGTRFGPGLGSVCAGFRY